MEIHRNPMKFGFDINQFDYRNYCFSFLGFQ